MIMKLPHDLLFQSASGYKPINVDDLLLANSVGAIHGLQILHRIPIVLDEDDRIGSRQVQSETTNLSCQQQHVDRWILIEPFHHQMPGTYH